MSEINMKIPPVRKDNTIPGDARCQEASFLSREDYVPCGAPAVAIVYHDKDRRGYYMCGPCADHNVRNRGGLLVAEAPVMPRTLSLCGPCREKILELLAQKQRRIIEAAIDEDREAGIDRYDEESSTSRAQAHCFHLMELARIVRGEPTCGQFDDYGPGSGPIGIDAPARARNMAGKREPPE